MLFIFIAMGFYTAAILFIAAASRNLNSTLAAGLINIVAAIIPLGLSIGLLSRKTLVNHKFGVMMAILGGLCIAFYSMAIAKSYSVNKVGIVAPAVFGGAILVSTVLSVFIFKQKINALEGLGLVLLAIGLGIIVYARATA